jgi:T4 RnlA family RNA ligase
MRYATELQQFIADHPTDWEERLSSPPYNLKISKADDGRVLLKYNQIMSDLSYQLCREARGIILDENTLEVVARAFDKFFNWGEALAAEIDWSTARIQEKVDGSIISLYHWRGEWYVKTNGTLSANTAEVEFPVTGIETFADLVNRAFLLYRLFPEELLAGYEDYTFSFEIASPYNRVVVPYDSIRLFYLLARNNVTGAEEPIELPNVERPREFAFGSLDELVESTKHLSYTDQEGYVVVDAQGNRIKVKGEDYLRIHRIRGEALPNEKRLMELILSKKLDDFLGIFPEYTDRANEVRALYTKAYNRLREDLIRYREEGWADPAVDRKRFALEFAKQTTVPAFAFSLRDGRVNNVSGFLSAMKPEKLLELAHGLD